jgi:hypothetical protein
MDCGGRAKLFYKPEPEFEDGAAQNSTGSATQVTRILYKKFKDYSTESIVDYFLTGRTTIK